MTKKLEDAIQKVRALSDAAQNEAAELLLSVAAKSENPISLDDDTRAAVREGLSQAHRGEFIDDADMAAFFARHDLGRA